MFVSSVSCVVPRETAIVLPFRSSQPFTSTVFRQPTTDCKRRIGLGEIDHLGALGRDREGRDDDVRLVGLDVRDAGRAGGLDEFELEPQVLGEKLGGFDVRARRLKVGVHHAGWRNRQVGRNADLLRLHDVVEQVSMGGCGAERHHAGHCELRQQ